MLEMLLLLGADEIMHRQSASKFANGRPNRYRAGNSEANREVVPPIPAFRPHGICFEELGMNSGFPSSAQSPVELYQGQSFIELSLYQAEFGGEIVGFVGKDFEITRNTAVISHVR